MADSEERTSGAGLPPKLQARKLPGMTPAQPVVQPAVQPAAQPVAQSTVQPVAAHAAPRPAPEPVVRVAPQPVAAAAARIETVRAPAARPAAAAPARPISATAAIPKSAPAVVVPLAAVAAPAAESKSDTSVLRLEDARPAPPATPGQAQAPRVGTVRLSAGARPPLSGSTQKIAIAPPAAEPAAPRPDTVRAAAPAPAAADGVRVDTIRLKQPGELGRLPSDKEPAAPVVARVSAIAASNARTIKKEAPPAPAAAAAPAGPVPTGPQTIRVKKPGPAAELGDVPTAPQRRSETARITLGDAVAASGGAGAMPSSATGPATIRLKAPDAAAGGSSQRPSETARISLSPVGEGAAAPAAEEAKSGGATLKTIRIKRPSEMDTVRRVGVAVSEKEAEPEEDPASQRKTISLKRSDSAVSDREKRFTEEEDSLKRERGLIKDETRPERAGWVCAVAAVIVIVIGVLMWVFCVQLMPKNENLNWPGRTLPSGDKFFQNEREWI